MARSTSSSVAVSDTPIGGVSRRAFAINLINALRPGQWTKNLLIFNGLPLHFLDIFIVASRDRKDSDDLASLILEQLADSKTHAAIVPLLALSTALPPAAVVTAGLEAAALLGDVAYHAVRAVSDKTLGMYRGSFLQFLAARQRDAPQT